MTDSEILEKIRSKYPDNYQEEAASQVLKLTLEKLSPIIKKALIAFLETGSHDEIVLFGYSVEKLIQEKNMNEIAAFLSLDWIVKDPDSALAQLKSNYKEGKPNL